MNNSDVDHPLHDEAALRTLICSAQTRYAKARGSRALAELVADGFVTISTIIANLPPDRQAAILDEHGVKAAAGGTSKYTPWIKVIWGEYDPDESATFQDSTGKEHRCWLPDRSMERYHHTMEALESNGVVADHAKFILEHGGAQKMAETRQQRLLDENRPARQADEEEKRDFFLKETRPQFVKNAIPIPEGAGDYVTVLCRRREGGLELLAVVNKDASAELTRLAQRSYDELRKAAEERAREEELAGGADQSAPQRLLATNPGMLQRIFAGQKQKTAQD